MPRLIVRSLPEIAYDRLPEMFAGMGANHPGFRAELCRVVQINGQVIAAVLIERRTLRYGGADLRAGLVRGFYHAGGYRRHLSAHLTALMRDALAQLAEQGAHLALLRVDRAAPLPIPAADFGFVPVWPHTFFSCDSRAAAQLDPPQDLCLRAIRPHDVPQVAALYERHFGAHVTLARSPQTWLWRVATQTPPALVIAGAQPATLYGYIAGVDLLADAVELAVDSPDAARLLLSDAGRRAYSAGIESLAWTVPPDSVLVAFARQLLDVTVSAHYPRSGGWMARLIDTRGLVAALLPELTAQLQHTGAMSSPTLSAHADFIRLEAGHSAVDIAHTDFIELLFGALSPAALGIKAGLPAAAVALLVAAFPPRVTGIGAWDG